MMLGTRRDRTLVTRLLVKLFMLLSSLWVTEALSSNTDQVMFVGNNWDGTITIIEPQGGYEILGRINGIPDFEQRMKEIKRNPIKYLFFIGIRTTVGEGNDQFVDDMYSTPDGTALVISRPSFADVVSISLTTGEINWRFPVKGYRSDHMAVSPDGLEVAVSASTGNVVHLLDIYSGEEKARR